MRQILIALVVVLASPAMAQVDPKIHKLCSAAKDYAGCVKTMKSESATPNPTRQSEILLPTKKQQEAVATYVGNFIVRMEILKPENMRLENIVRMPLALSSRSRLVSTRPSTKP